VRPFPLSPPVSHFPPAAPAANASTFQVDEGVDIFNDIYHKVYSTDQQKLKEKYESDLKTEIKKLQRMRDQIKTWLAGNDIKDKNQLIEARKVIEEKMELFRVCEKETKTKAFSKEGLARQASTDPKDAEREEKRAWVNGCLERLQVRCRTAENLCAHRMTTTFSFSVSPSSAPRWWWTWWTPRCRS